MAAGQGDVERTGRLMDWLLMPTPAHRLLLGTLGAGLGHAVWRLATVDLIVTAASMAFTAGVAITIFVWKLRKDMDAIAADFDTDWRLGRARASKIVEMKRRAAGRAVFVALLTVLIGLPVVSNVVLNDVWNWMAVVSGVALAEAGHSLLIALTWETELSSQRLRNKERRAAAERRTALISKLSDS